MFDKFQYWSQAAPLVWTGILIGWHFSNPNESVTIRIFVSLLFLLMDVVLGFLFTYTRHGDF